MAITRDVVTENLRTGTASPQTFSHAAAASGVRGVLLAIIHGTSSTDHVSAASYGGVAMSRVQRNTDTATEPGAAEFWWLAGAIPQGTQTVSYTPGSTTDDIHAVCITILADDTLEVIDTDGVNDNAANPSVTLQYGGRLAMAFGAFYGGGADPTAFTPNANCTTLADEDLGAFYSEVFAQTTAGTADFAIGGSASSDDVAFAAVAIAEIMRGHAVASVAQPVLVDTEAEPRPTNHAQTMFFGRSSSTPARPRLWMWPAALAAALGMAHAVAADDVRVNHDLLHKFRAHPDATGHFILPANQVVIVEPDRDAQRVNHQQLHQYRVGFQTIGQPWMLRHVPTRSEQSIEADAYRVDHNKLHRHHFAASVVNGQPRFLWPRLVQQFDVEEQQRQKPVDLMPFRAPPAVAGPGQPWYLWKAAVAPQDVPDDAQRIDHARRLSFGNIAVQASGHFLFPSTSITLVESDVRFTRGDHTRLLFGRSTPAAPQTRQPFFMWRKSVPIFEVEEYELRKPVDLSPFRQFEPGSFIWYQEIPDQEVEQNPERVDHTKLFRFRGYAPAAVPPRQPFFMWPKAKPDLSVEDDASRIDHAERLLFGRTTREQSGTVAIQFGQVVLVEQDIDPAVRADHSRRLLFGKSPPVVVIGQPWYLTRAAKGDQTSEPDVQRISHSNRLFFGRTVAAALPGQPWYLTNPVQLHHVDELQRGEPDADRGKHSALLTSYGRQPPPVGPPPTGLPRRVPRMWSRMFS